MQNRNDGRVQDRRERNFDDLPRVIWVAGVESSSPQQADRLGGLKTRPQPPHENRGFTPRSLADCLREVMPLSSEIMVEAALYKLASSFQG